MDGKARALLPLGEYDKVIVAFSGGKDSLACVLRMLDLGVPRERLELWHHHVDGAPGSDGLMDWPCTEGYCRAVAKALGLTLRFSWREGGFEREMLRDGTATAPVRFEATDGTVRSAGGKGPAGKRLKFPQVSANLSVRWCSAYLKIDVARRVFSNDPGLACGSYLFVTGERRQESAARAKYAEVEAHASDRRGRRVDQWRAVIDWTEAQVWDAIRARGILPHPAYRLGWGRVSCLACIFGQADQWASVRVIARESFDRIAEYEKSFGLTIKRGESVVEQADRGVPYLRADHPLRAVAMSREYAEDVTVGDWTVPVGAFRSCGGPT